MNYFSHFLHLDDVLENQYIFKIRSSFALKAKFLNDTLNDSTF